MSLSLGITKVTSTEITSTDRQMPATSWQFTRNPITLIALSALGAAVGGAIGFLFSANPISIIAGALLGAIASLALGLLLTRTKNEPNPTVPTTPVTTINDPSLTQGSKPISIAASSASTPVTPPSRATLIRAFDHALSLLKIDESNAENTLPKDLFSAPQDESKIQALYNSMTGEKLTNIISSAYTCYDMAGVINTIIRELKPLHLENTDNILPTICSISAIPPNLSISNPLNREMINLIKLRAHVLMLNPENKEILRKYTHLYYEVHLSNNYEMSETLSVPMQKSLIAEVAQMRYKEIEPEMTANARNVTRLLIENYCSLFDIPESHSFT
ncbi:MAG: TMEM14 family protein [Chlamydiales bacterium]